MGRNFIRSLPVVAQLHEIGKTAGISADFLSHDPPWLPREAALCDPMLFVTSTSFALIVKECLSEFKTKICPVRTFGLLRFFFSFVQNVDKKPNYWSIIEKVKDFYSLCCRNVLDLNLNRRHLKLIRSVGKSADGSRRNSKP